LDPEIFLLAAIVCQQRQKRSRLVSLIVVNVRDSVSEVARGAALVKGSLTRCPCAAGSAVLTGRERNLDRLFRKTCKQLSKQLSWYAAGLAADGALRPRP
jgi:hypothetical protein